MWHLLQTGIRKITVKFQRNSPLFFLHGRASSVAFCCLTLLSSPPSVLHFTASRNLFFTPLSHTGLCLRGKPGTVQWARTHPSEEGRPEPKPGPAQQACMHSLKAPALRPPPVEELPPTALHHPLTTPMYGLSSPADGLGPDSPSNTHLPDLSTRWRHQNECPQKREVHRRKENPSIHTSYNHLSRLGSQGLLEHFPSSMGQEAGLHCGQNAT